MEKFGVEKELFSDIRTYDYEVICGSSDQKYPDEFGKCKVSDISALEVMPLETR